MKRSYYATLDCVVEVEVEDDATMEEGIETARDKLHDIMSRQRSVQDYNINDVEEEDF